MKPFFSICIPVYNGMEYLRDTFKSIVNQTFQDFEVIIVDDCSNDGSFQFIQALAKEDKRVKLFQNQSNLGLVENWNQCIKHARGIWVKFVFQDDLWEPNCLEMVYQVTHDNEFVFHGRKFLIDQDAEESLKTFYTSHAVLDPPDLNGLTKISSHEIARIIAKEPGFNFFGEPSNVAFRKDLTEKVGFFNNRLAQLCDYEYWCRICTNVGGYYIEKTLSSFRVHPKSTSSSNLAFKKIRYKYLDQLIVLNEFDKNPLYFSFRNWNNAISFKSLYLEQVERIAYMLGNFSYEEQRSLRTEIYKYAPFACKYLTGFPYMRLRFKIFIKRILAWMFR